MLPDVDPNDRDVRENGVLVRRRRDLEALGGRVDTLQ